MGGSASVVGLLGGFMGESDAVVGVLGGFMVMSEVGGFGVVIVLSESVKASGGEDLLLVRGAKIE